ncbi:MAG: hypothetical protein WDW36_002566 [Sanguina aurantia]
MTEAEKTALTPWPCTVPTKHLTHLPPQHPPELSSPALSAGLGSITPSASTDISSLSSEAQSAILPLPQPPLAPSATPAQPRQETSLPNTPASYYTPAHPAANIPFQSPPTAVPVVPVPASQATKAQAQPSASPAAQPQPPASLPPAPRSRTAAATAATPATATTTPASLLLPSSAAAAAVSFLGGVLDVALGGGGGGDRLEGDTGVEGGSAEGITAVRRTVQLLRGRLGEAKDENQQLEGLLRAAEAKVQREQAGCRQLQQEMTTLGSAKSFAEATLQAQLAAASDAVRVARERGEEGQRQLHRQELRVGELEEANRQLQRRKEDLEGGMLDALQQQLLESEGRLEAEHRAHARTKSASAVREQQLERAVEDSGDGLAGLQRAVEEAGRRNRGTEQQLALLAAERNELTAQLGLLTAAAAGGGNSSAALSSGGQQQRGGEGSAQPVAMDALRSELHQQRKAAGAAERARAAADSCAAELRGQVLRMQEAAAALKDTSPLEAQLRGASEMLVMKQAQIERLAGDKAAATIRLERDLSAAQQEAAAARVAAAAAAARLGSVEEGYAGFTSGGRGGALSDMVPMDALGESYERLARSGELGKVVRYTARMLDSSAATASMVLRRYPAGRLAIFLYILFIHVYVYFLTGYLQRVVGRLDSSASGAGALSAARGLLPTNTSSAN